MKVDIEFCMGESVDRTGSRGWRNRRTIVKID
jgi:hypothetical protein